MTYDRKQQWYYTKKFKIVNTAVADKKERTVAAQWTLTLLGGERNAYVH